TPNRYYVRYTLAFLFFLHETAPTAIYTLSLHDALPISPTRRSSRWRACARRTAPGAPRPRRSPPPARARRWRTLRSPTARAPRRSEEHTSELQSLAYLVCRLLLEKKKK